MGKKKGMEARAAKFVSAVAKKLADTSSLDVILQLEPLLAQAVSDLPQGGLRTALESDLSRFASLLREKIREIRPEFEQNVHENLHKEQIFEENLQKSDENLQKEQICEENLARLSLEKLLKLSQQSVLSKAAFCKAVESLVVAAENGASGSEWIVSSRRLLGSRKNPPLALWWTYAALELHSTEKCTGTLEERGLHIVSSARHLLDRLKALIAGRFDAFSAVSALAPVVGLLFETGCILRSAIREKQSPSKYWRRALKSLKSLCKEIIGTLAVYTSRKQVNAHANQDWKDQDLSLDFRALVMAGKAISKLTGIDNSDRKGIGKIFPLASNEMKKSLALEICDSRICSSVVFSEALLMRLMVEVLEHRENILLENHKLSEELKFIAAHRADVLIDSLLDSKLPVNPILDDEQELFLRRILYDVILAYAPTYKSSDKDTGLFIIFIKKLSLAKAAVEFYRSQGLRTKAVEVSSRQSQWEIPIGFSEWLRSLKLKQKPSQDVSKDTRKLLGWLLETADIPSILAGVIHNKDHNTMVMTEATIDEAFFVDKKGEFEAADKAFATVAESMRSGKQEEVAFERHQVTVAEIDNVDHETVSSESEDEKDGFKKRGPFRDEDREKDSLTDAIEAVLAGSDAHIQQGELSAIEHTKTPETVKSGDRMQERMQTPKNTTTEETHSSGDMIQEPKENLKDPAMQSGDTMQEHTETPKNTTAEDMQLEEAECTTPTQDMQSEQAEGAKPKGTAEDIHPEQEEKSTRKRSSKQRAEQTESTPKRSRKDMTEEGELTTPKQSRKDTTAAPSSLRYTRSGRKYGDSAAPTAITTRKRRKTSDSQAEE